MKVDLSIHCPKAFTLGDLCYQSGQALMETLGLVRIPDLSTAIEEKGKLHRVEKEFLCGVECPVVMIGFKDLVENVRMVFKEISPKPGVEGLNANILVPEEPLWVALGASVAVGLAKIQDSPIIDSQLFFGAALESTPGEVIQALRKHGLFDEIQQAVQRVFCRPSLPVFDPEALKALQIEEQMDKVMVDMLGIIKVSKRVEPALFTRFYFLLDQILSGKRENQDNRKDILGLLLLVYEYLAEEGKRMRDPRPVHEEAKRIGSKIMSMGFELSDYTLSKLTVGP